MENSMQSKTAGPKKIEPNSLIAILLIGLSGILFFLYLSTNSENSETSFSAKAQTQKLVNHHLMMTNEQINLSQQRQELHNGALTKDLNSTHPQPKYELPSEGTILSQENSAAEMANLLGRGERKTNGPISPDDIIQADLFNKDQNEAYTQAYKKEYARQFIENARKGGYNIKLNEDFKVLSVEKIKRPIPNPYRNILDASGKGNE